MSLDTTISIATSGLGAAKKLINNSSSNISNRSNPNYIKKELELKSIHNGVDVVNVTRRIDHYLQTSIIEQASNVGYSKAMSKYSKEIQSLFGKPNTSNTLDFAIDDFFSSLSKLSNNPERDSARYEVINKAQNLSSKISYMGQELQNLRFDADKNIKTTIDFVNDQLSAIDLANKSIVGIDDSFQLDLLQTRDDAIKNLAEKVNISVFYKSNNQVYINTSEGLPLVDNDKYILEYSPVSSTTHFIKNLPISQLESYQLDSQCQKFSVNNLITSGVSEVGGTSTNITSVLESGEILALKELRDNTIPMIIDQLDNLAYTITNQFNKIHNSGSGFPASKILTGTRAISASDYKSFSGQVRIGIIDQNGDPIAKADGTRLNPLLLDLSALSSSNINGQYDVQTLLNEINQYFDVNPSLATTSIGNLHDIKLVAKTPLSKAPNGEFIFDFEIENNSQLDASFEIMSINVTDTNCMGLVGNLPEAYNSQAGARARTNLPISVDFTGGSGGPYNIEAKIKVTDSLGNISTSVVSYQINDNPADLNIQNKRYNTDHIVSGSAVINSANNVTSYAYASIVDQKGNPVAANMPGYLQIKTLNNRYSISIDDLNSNELGLPNKASPTDKGFSQYFELNDFFVRNSNANSITNDPLISGSAINFSVRSDILNDSNFMSFGKLTPSQAYYETSKVGDKFASGSIRFNSNPSIGDYLLIDNTKFTFVSSSNSNDQISIGSTLADTLANIKNTLNANNLVTAQGADLATYEDNKADTLLINFKTSGTIGNNFSLSASFSSIKASINNAIFSSIPNGYLERGSDKDVTVLQTPFSYGLGIGNNFSVLELAELSNKQIHFDKAGGLSATFGTISNYITNIIAYQATAVNKTVEMEKQQMLVFDVYNDRMKSMTGVDLDQELINITEYQQYYSANAKVISITNELYKELLSIIR